MDNRRVLIDTTIIIGYARRKEKENTLLYNLYQSYDTMFVSSVTVFEAFYGCNPEHERAMAHLFKGFVIIPFDGEIAKAASREYLRIRTAGNEIDVRELVVGVSEIV